MFNQSLMSIFEEYQQIPKLRNCSEYFKSLRNTYLQDFLNKPTIHNLISVIDADKSISNLFSEKILAKIFAFELSQENHSNVTLLNKPEVVSFEELKKGDIYVLCSEIQVFLDFNNSSYFNFKTMEFTECQNMDEEIYNSNSEHPIILIGRFDLQDDYVKDFIIF